MNKRDLDGYTYCLDKAKSNNHKNFYNYLSTSKKISIKNRIDKSLDLKEFLIKTIIGQQISVSAAKSIWENTYPIIKKNKFNENDLKNCGVSNMKQKYIMSVNDYLNKNPQHKSSLKKLSKEELNKIFLPLKGIGPWTINIMQMFYLEDKDIWLPGDLGIQKSFKYFFEDNDMDEIQNLYKPYRTYFCLYLWSGLSFVKKN